MSERLLVAAALLLALAAAITVLRRRAVYLLGRRGGEVAPTILLSLWLAGLALGQTTGSLAGMALTATLPLCGAAIAARRWTTRRRVRRPRFTRIDLAVVAIVAGTVLVCDIFDVHCHRAVSGAFLRGNIPPTALNDPRFPLPYHALFDAIVALLVRALSVDTELGLDLVTIGCIALTMGNLRSLSRWLFRTPLAAQMGRVLFFLGFGPTFVRLLSNRDIHRVHGQTTQAYIDIILRRPPALGFVLLTGLIAALAPRFARVSSTIDRRRVTEGVWRFATHPAWLLPLMFVIPLLAEELVLHVAVFVAPLLVRRKLPPGWIAAGLVALACGIWRSGVFAAVFGHGSAMAAPHLGLAWPPTVPAWTGPPAGIPLLSWAALGVLLTELGPIVLATMLLVVMKGPSLRRTLLAPLLAGTAVAVFSRLDGWRKSDLDRFLFYGTPFPFMLIPTWLETPGVLRWLERGRRHGLALALGLTVVVAGMPTLQSVVIAYQNRRSWNHFWRDEPGATLRERLGMVGARDVVLVSDAGKAYDMVQAGFVVLAPMTSTSIGEVNGDLLADYVKTNAGRADWLLVRDGDARLSGRKAAASFDGYTLARARP